MDATQTQLEWLAFRGQVRVGDIILVHARKGWLQRYIRWRTKSYWNHSIIVFETWDKLPFGGPLIADIASDGVAVHRLKKYTDRFDLYDIGVMRYPGLTEEQARAFVTSFILSNIDTPYDYPRLVGLLFKPWAERLLKVSGLLWVSRLFINERLFDCSSFVHKAFHRFHELPFNEKGPEGLYRTLEREEMASPGNIAADALFEWEFNKSL